MCISGIYKITNRLNNKVYIGKTKNFKKRWSQYRYDFDKRRTRSINQYLMNSMIKYGFDNFIFSIVECLQPEECSERELYWMDFYNSCDRNCGYNLRRDSSTGMVTHESTSNKISNRLKLEWESGIRSEHSLKLKKSWESRDREQQGKLFTKTLTKYLYKLHYVTGVIVVNYKGLIEHGMKNVVATFCEKKSNLVKFKGIIIERILYED